ncbi:MAG: phage adaptor protein [Planctomycetota bacterium]|jgi:hypothetical protein
MATMQYQYQELYKRVSRFLGTHGDSGPTGADLTEAQDYVKSGYMQFLTAYDWTFRRRYATITMEPAKWVYEMPEDFGGIRTKFCFTRETGYPPLDTRSEQEIIELRTYGEYNAYPEVFHVRSGQYNPQGGQRYEAIFWPTPSADYELYYSYFSMPPMMSNDTDVPMGGAEVAEAILRSCIAAAEDEGDETIGPQAQKAQLELQRAIAQDKNREPKELGYAHDHQRLSSWQIARGSTRINNVNYNT